MTRVTDTENPPSLAASAETQGGSLVPAPPGRHVVLDANVLSADYELRGPLWRLLALDVSEGSLVLHVPEVCFTETVANHRRAMDKNLAELDALRVKMGRLIGQANAAFASCREVPQDQREGYETLLRERLEQLGAELLPYPIATHEEITERATSRKPPFNDKGGGYRHTLIWLSVLELAADTGQHVCLVSMDKAFHEGPSLSPCDASRTRTSRARSSASAT